MWGVDKEKFNLISSHLILQWFYLKNYVCFETYGLLHKTYGFSCKQKSQLTDANSRGMGSWWGGSSWSNKLWGGSGWWSRRRFWKQLIMKEIYLLNTHKNGPLHALQSFNNLEKLQWNYSNDPGAVWHYEKYLSGTRETWLYWILANNYAYSEISFNIQKNLKSKLQLKVHLGLWGGSWSKWGAASWFSSWMCHPSSWQKWDFWWNTWWSSHAVSIKHYTMHPCQDNRQDLH